MDINLLVVNVGNSRMAVGAFVAGELKHVARMPLENSSDWQGVIASAWNEIKDKDEPAIAGSCVNPRVLEQVEHAIHQATAANIEWVGQQIEVPIGVLTDQPKETGVDRVLNIAAAYEQMGKACVVVDAGTAVTIDCCNDNGDFLGGAIAPGVAMQLEAMHQKTSKLPAVSMEVPHDAYGKNTSDAMRQGVYYGIRGLLKEVVENYATDLGTWPDVIATGGDAEKLFGGWELIHAIAPDLTLYGIALAYANHHIRHEK